MENASTAETPDDLIDIASVRLLDLRMLQQDEIRCLARICGDVPARLQDLVDVIVDKSVFNESAGSRRQTFDRDRLPRNKPRHFLSNLSSAQLRSAIESAGRSQKDLLIHLCRQLNISEKGDRALYQPQVPSGVVVVDGNRSMSLKRMARASASLAGRADGSMAPPPSKAAAELLVNGKDLDMEVLHRPSKKMKTKEEARRRAAEFQTETAFSADKQAFRAVKVTWLDDAESVRSKNLPFGGMKKIRCDFQSPEAGTMGAIGHSVGISKPSDFPSGVEMERPSEGTELIYICNTCKRSFANVYSLRRHTATTGHAFDRPLKKSGIGRKRKKFVVTKNALRCSCGNTYATLYTLRRHAKTNGHSFKLLNSSQETMSIVAHQEQMKKDEAKDDKMDSKLERQNQRILPTKRAWKRNMRHFKCRQCLRQFVWKKQYIVHLEKHYQRKKKKGGKTRHKALGRQVSESSKKVKVRVGRPLKLEPDVDVIQEVGKKRKHEPLSMGKRAGAHKTEAICQQTPDCAPSGKPRSFTCQECGKIFDEFSRYTGHLSMHSRLKRVLASETSSPTSAVLKKDVMNLRNLSALGFRTLLNDKTGTYLSGLPATLLFSGSAFTKEVKGKG